MVASKAPGLEPRNDHFVPRGFLQQWCGPDNQLRRIHRAYGKLYCRSVGPKGVAFRRDLYNLQDLGESLAIFLTLSVLGTKFRTEIKEYNFEKTLMKEIDERGISAHRKFLTDDTAPGDPQALYDLLRFIYVLRARNPRYLEKLQGEVIGDLEKLLRARGLSNNVLLNVDDLRRDLNAAKLTVIEAVLNDTEFKRRHDNMACVHYDVDVSLRRSSRQIFLLWICRARKRRYTWCHYPLDAA